MAADHEPEDQPAATRSAGTVAKATEGGECVAKGEKEAARPKEGDPRPERTRLAILEAFVALCRERGLESTSVAAICERAGVNRATFYRHYEDRADLLDRGLEAMFADIGERIDPPSVEEGRTRDSAQRRIELLFELVEKRAGIVRPIMSGEAGAELRAKALDYCETYLADRRLSRLGLPGEEYALLPEAIPRALASLFFGIASWWLEEPSRRSAREVAACYLSFIAFGLFKPAPSP
jgi:AcrR family transcriptional regulator